MLQLIKNVCKLNCLYQLKFVRIHCYYQLTFLPRIFLVLLHFSLSSFCGPCDARKCILYAPLQTFSTITFSSSLLLLLLLKISRTVVNRSARIAWSNFSLEYSCFFLALCHFWHLRIVLVSFVAAVARCTCSLCGKIKIKNTLYLRTSDSAFVQIIQL